MSELKAIRSGEIYNIIEYEDCYRTDDLYYPKSEADKAIEELKKEKEYVIEQTAEVINGQEEELRHHKYKRCLAMARCCESELYQYPQFGEQSSEERRLQKWRKRWLKIAKKFKEAK